MTTTTAATVYPVHVDADLDPGLSRGLWIVKWLLAIPHYVILAFLWTAFVVLSVVAFFSILFTGRYPRPLFDFNVGVMRWNWRVAYYAYGALGTDRYPPFTLADVPDYPAHLEVDYPERLSRGLVLVKWWLLAIPHYLIVGLFLGGVTHGVRGADEEPLLSISLIGLLVLIAAVALLFTGRYPRRIFDLVLGLNRWVLRVAGYVALMTDRYPPFSLDQGGHENDANRNDSRTTVIPPSSSEADPEHPAGPPPTTYAPPPPPGRGPGWTTGRVVSVVLGSLLVAAGLGLATGGGTLVAADQLARDADGFMMSPREQLTTDGFAIVSEDAKVHTDGTPDGLPEALFGDVRISARATGGTELFVGVAPTGDVREYLGDVRHDTLLEISDGDPVYRSSPGGALEAPPTEQDFWVAEATGTDPTLTWTPVDGDWAVVVMNADGSDAVTADVAAGAEVPLVATVTAILFVLAGLALLIGGLLIAVPVRAASRPAPSQSIGPSAPGSTS
jgi:hypothetical protein